MNPGAGVTSLDALSEWYAALVEFRGEAQNALSSLALSLQRAADWLDQQEQYWRRQIRVLEEEVSQAKTELMNRQFTDFLGQKLDCSVQEENLRRARARLEFAEDRLGATRRWSKRLPQETRDVYDGPTRHLGFFLDGELPRALAALERQLTALEKYANLRADVAAPAPAPKPDKEKP
jgi:hypothetical protein